MTDNKKKIIFFTPGSVGGAERVTLTVAKMLPTEEYDVIVVHVCREVCNIEKFVPEWINQHHIQIRNIYDFTTLRLISLLKKERPYAVFSSLNHLNVRVVLAARICRIQKIIIRNNIGWSNWRKVNKFLAKYLYRFATDIISQSEEMHEEFASVFKNSKNLLVIPNPLDLDAIEEKIKYTENPLDSNKINYIYVGRIDSVKGLDTLLTAFKDVLMTLPDAFLTLVGDTSKSRDYYSRLKTLAQNLGIDKYIQFAGFQDNPYKYIKNADCFVLPSRKEGNPNVLHEAMWLKIPVVATNSVPIISRMVTSDRGDVVEVDDSKELAAAMIRRVNIPVSKPYDYAGGNLDFLNLFR